MKSPYVIFLTSLFIVLSSVAYCLELCQMDVGSQYLEFQTDHIWNKNGKRITTYSNFHLRAYQLYLDAYLSKTDCFSFNSAYIWIEEELNGVSRGVSDSELSWTRFFYIDPVNTVSFQATAIIPSGNQIYNLRYGKWGAQLSLLYSATRTIKNQTVFFDSIIGYRFYKGFPSDQLRGYLSAGTFIFPNFYLDGALDLQYGLFNGKNQFNYPLFLLNPNYRLLRADIRASYCFYNNMYLAGGVFSHLYGQNVATGWGYFIQGWYRY